MESAWCSRHMPFRRERTDSLQFASRSLMPRGPRACIPQLCRHHVRLAGSEAPQSTRPACAQRPRPLALCLATSPACKHRREQVMGLQTLCWSRFVETRPTFTSTWNQSALPEPVGKELTLSGSFCVLSAPHARRRERFMVSLAERAPSGCPGSLIVPATFVHRSKSWILNITFGFSTSSALQHA